ncbi:phage tail protein [Roseateles sp.]|uniref:phage tail protein n=1 Tax=Roseateles sp. TaxID=1971397 RepID=UPI00393815CC
MADDGSTQSPTVWPLPKFHFRVTLDGVSASFSEVSGLSAETQPIEYRAGDSKTFSVLKMPGLKKVSDVTLKRGVTTNPSALIAWIQSSKLNEVQRKPVTIELIDEAGGTTMSWTLSNAFPTKITGTDLKASGNEVAIESLVLAHDGLSVSGR